MGWTIGCSSFKTEDELKVFIKDELEKGNTLYGPPWYEKWNMVDGHFDILNYESDIIRNYKEWLKD